MGNLYIGLDESLVEISTNGLPYDSSIGNYLSARVEKKQQSKNDQVADMLKTRSRSLYVATSPVGTYFLNDSFKRLERAAGIRNSLGLQVISISCPVIIQG